MHITSATTGALDTTKKARTRAPDAGAEQIQKAKRAARKARAEQTDGQAAAQSVKKTRKSMQGKKAAAPLSVPTATQPAAATAQPAANVPAPVAAGPQVVTAAPQPASPAPQPRPVTSGSPDAQTPPAAPPPQTRARAVQDTAPTKRALPAPVASAETLETARARAIEVQKTDRAQALVARVAGGQERAIDQAARGYANARAMQSEPPLPKVEGRL